MNIKESKYWADQIARKVVAEFPNEKLYTVASGITPSGTIHIGNFREIITVDLIYRALRDLGKRTRFIYSWDDYDRIRKIPKNLPDTKEYEKYMFMPGVDAPDPWKCHKSYTEHFEKELMADLPIVGIKPEYIYQNKMYRDRTYAKNMKAMLERRFEIRKLLNNYRTEPLEADWYPVAVYCEKCNREQTKILGWDGEYTLTYECNSCKHKGDIDFSKVGNVKLGWRTDWPMRWMYEPVHCEGGGKDHNSPGAGLDTGHDICKLFNRKPPIRFFYDFITIKGVGGKMSSSLGNVIRLKDALSVYLPEVIRYIFAGTRPQTEFSLSFDEDVFKVYDDFYKCERIYFGNEKVNDREQAHWSRVYEMSAVDKPPSKMPIQPAFKHCVGLINVYQTPEAALASILASQKLTKADQKRYLMMLERARTWIDNYAPDQYVFKLQEEPSSAGLSVDQVAALSDLAKALKTKKILTEVFGEIAKAHDLGMKDFFSAVYQVLVGKERGPRLAQFIEAIGRRKIAKSIEAGLQNTKKQATTKRNESSSYNPIKGDFEIQKEVIEKFPGLKCGIAVIRGVKVQKSIPELEKLKKETVKQMIKEFKDIDLREVPILKEYRRIYKATGVDPTKKKPSPLALLTRIKKGQDLYTVNTLVDVYNLAVMKTQVSMGAFDLQNLSFPTYLRFAKEGEQFTPLMADKASSLHKGELIYADKNRLVFCRDLNYRDSDFTKITNKTKDTILYVDGTSVTSEKELKSATELAIKWILKYCGGKLEKVKYTF
jgi:lysyl-tRNA synthetase, class I